MSGLTGKPLSGLTISAPMQHVRAGCHVPVKREDFEIIGLEKDSDLLQLKESLLITTLKPRLNNNTTSVPLHLFS